MKTRLEQKRHYKRTLPNKKKEKIEDIINQETQVLLLEPVPPSIDNGHEHRN